MAEDIEICDGCGDPMHECTCDGCERNEEVCPECDSIWAEWVGNEEVLKMTGRNIGMDETKERVLTEGEQKQKQFMEQWLIFVNETLEMLPDNKRDYWGERIIKVGTFQTKMKLCQIIRDRYEADWRKTKVEQATSIPESPAEAAPVPVKKRAPRKKKEIVVE